MYTRDTVVAVQPFSRQQEGDDIVIGRIETGVFVAVPSEAIELLEQFAEGKSVGEVADECQRKNGEVPDLGDFLEYLESKGIVAPVGKSVSDQSTDPSVAVLPKPRKVKYHFTNFSQSLAQRLFDTPVLWTSLALSLIAAGLVIYDPTLIPGPRDLYFPDHRTMIWIILIFLGYGAVYIHELGHLIAARALGINSRMGISHRLWHVVVETDLTGLWSVSKQQRYLPLFAGAIIDVVSGALTIMLLFAQTRHWLPLTVVGVRVTRAMAFTYVMRIIWQCLLFIRTDFYYVIASVFNCRSLLSDTEDFLRNMLHPLLPWVRYVNQSAIPPFEKRVIRVYSVVWVVGRIAAFSLLWVITIPLFARYSRSLAGAVRAGYSANPGNFVDALVFTLYFLVPVTVGFTLWIRTLVRGERTLANGNN
jgi:hypothetical protein